ERAELETARARLASVWGRSGAERDDLPAVARALVAREISMARIDLSLGVPAPGPRAQARVAALADAGVASVPAQVLGPAPDPDPTTQGRGTLLLVERAPWPPRTALVAWLTH